MADTAPDTEQSGPSPRHTAELQGHQAGEEAFLAAYNSGRLHHAWLITGARGVGKATLAYRMARFLLCRDDGGAASLFGESENAAYDSLHIAPDNPVFQRIAAGGHGNLRVIERVFDDKKKALQSEIPVDQVRSLHGFFAKTAAEDSWRVAIVDAADELNRHAGNALLKILEEPPPRSVLLLVSHAPGQIPATIRSRCRQLRLSPVAEDDVLAILKAWHPDLPDEDARALARLSGGAPGRALMLAEAGGLDLYRRMLGLLEGLPNQDIPALHRMAQELSAPRAENEYRLFVSFLSDWVARLARAAAGGETGREVVAGETSLLERMAGAAGLDRWLELWEKMGQLIARTDAVHLDRKQVLIALLGDLETAARNA